MQGNFLIHESEVLPSVLDALALLEFQPLGVKDLGDPLFVDCEGHGPSRDGVEEERLHVLHVGDGRLWR